jgi:hypothetical protein
MPSDYQLCGWRVRSGLDLPELPRWPGDAAGDPDVIIREGEVPQMLDGSAGPARYLMADAEGNVLLHLRGRFRFLIRGGSHVTVEFLTPGAREVWRTFLWGSVLSILCHQRGAYPLHAAGLIIQGRAVAIAGHRGNGKSTLALALMQRGHRLISDDLTVIRSDADAVEVIPAFPRLKLWRASIEAAGLQAEGLPPVRDGVDKYDLQPGGDFDLAPVPLHAILLLDEGEGPELLRQPPVAAIAAMQERIARVHVARIMGKAQDLLDRTARIVAKVPVYRLRRPKRFDALDATAELVEGLQPIPAR